MSRATRPAVTVDETADRSKTSRKHAMHALQGLGEQLVTLDPARLRSLSLPERLVDAVLLARTITRHEARRRQMQFIGRLMRDVDPLPLEAALKRWHAGPAEERARFAALEHWRTRLLDEAGALEAFMAAHPEADRQEIDALVVAARAERMRGGPPHRQRALFRAVRKASGLAADEAPGPLGAAPNADPSAPAESSGDDDAGAPPT